MSDEHQQELGRILSILEFEKSQVEVDPEHSGDVYKSISDFEFSDDLDLRDEFNKDLIGRMRAASYELLVALSQVKPEKAFALMNEISVRVFANGRDSSPLQLAVIDFAAHVAKARSDFDVAQYMSAWRVASIAAGANIPSPQLNDSIKEDKANGRRDMGFPSMPKIFMVYTPELDFAHASVSDLTYMAHSIVGGLGQAIVPRADNSTDRVIRYMEESAFAHHSIATLKPVLAELAQHDPVAAFDFAAVALKTLKYSFLDGAYPLAVSNDRGVYERGLAEWLYEASSEYVTEQLELKRTQCPDFEERVLAIEPLHNARLRWFSAALKKPWTVSDWQPIVDAVSEMSDSISFYANIHNRKCLDDDCVQATSGVVFDAAEAMHRLFGFAQGHAFGRKALSSLSVQNFETFVHDVSTLDLNNCKAALEAICRVHASDTGIFLMKPQSEELAGVEADILKAALQADSTEAIKHYVMLTMEAYDRSYSNPAYAAVAESRSLQLGSIVADWVNDPSLMAAATEGIAEYKRAAGYVSDHAKGFVSAFYERNSKAAPFKGFDPK